MYLRRFSHIIVVNADFYYIYGKSAIMAVEIKPLGIARFDLEITEPFFGGDVLQGTDMDFYPKRVDETIQVYVEVTYKLESMTEQEYTCYPAVMCVYQLQPVHDINEYDLYKCYTMTVEYLQSVIDAVYVVQFEKGAIPLQTAPFETVFPKTELALQQIFGGS